MPLSRQAERHQQVHKFHFILFFWIFTERNNSGGVNLDRRALTLISVILLVSIIGECLAAGIVVSPTRFEFKGAGVHGDKLTVSNPYRETTIITIRPKRILKDKKSLLLMDDGPARWIRVQNGSFALRPGERRDVKFQVNVPSNYNYRDAVGALVVTSTSRPGKLDSRGTSVTLKQVSEVIVPVVIGLPGEIRESLSIESFRAPSILIGLMPGSFSYTLKNRGNVYENFTSTIRLRGFLSDAVNSSGGVYPGDVYSDEVIWTPGILDMGIYKATINVAYGRYSSQKPVVAERTLIVIPVWLIVLLVLIVTVWFIRSRKPRIPRIRVKIER